MWLENSIFPQIVINLFYMKYTVHNFWGRAVYYFLNFCWYNFLCFYSVQRQNYPCTYKVSSYILKTQWNDEDKLDIHQSTKQEETYVWLKEALPNGAINCHKVKVTFIASTGNGIGNTWRNKHLIDVLYSKKKMNSAKCLKEVLGRYS